MKKFLFYLLVIIGVFSMLFGFFIHARDISIPLFTKTEADIRINIEIPKNFINDVQIYANGYKLTPLIMKTKNSYISYETNNYKIYTLAINADKKVISNINNIVITVGKNMYYYKPCDIFKFEKNKDGLYIFPKDIKYYKNSTYITDKGQLKKFFSFFMSIFYNFKFYIFSFICFLFAGIIYFKNKDKIVLGLNIFKKYAIWWILLLGLLLRIADNGFGFWSDELYTAMIASNPSAPFISTFKDPGNPPLYFILARLWMQLFGINEVVCRLLSVLFSILTISAVYLFTKKFCGLDKEKSLYAALFAAFLFAINPYSIQSAQEFRCYSLGAFLAVIAAYYFFKIVKYKENKDFIIYGIIAALMANTHYFQILILFGNFILAMFILDNKSKLKFFFANLFGAICFLPYFFTTALNDALMDKTFNPLPAPSFQYMTDTFVKYFASAPLAILVIVLALILLFPKIKKFLLENTNGLSFWHFCVYSVIYLFVAAYIFSLFRPIVRQYYYTNIIAFVVLVAAFILFIPFKNKLIKILISVFVLLFYFGGTNYVNKDKVVLYTFENIIKYAYYDSPQFRKNGDKIGIIFREVCNHISIYNDFLHKDEIITAHEFNITPDVIYNSVLENPADVCYVILKFNIYSDFVSKYSKYFDIALIRTNDDIIIARVVKKT